jgi:NDMA-dependent alcohol dehydrogenase
MRTRAAILWAVGEPWSVEEVDIDPPGQHEVLVRLASSGMCHSDDHAQKGDMYVALPTVGGHEGAGVVEAVGPGVSLLRRGDHVILSFLPSCGHCRWCASGHQNLCDLGQFLTDGIPFSDGKCRVHARGRDVRQLSTCGTFSPYAVVSERSPVKIDGDLPLEVASLVGCGVSTGYGAAVNLVQVRPGETVVVVGAGGVGSSAVQGARISGAEHIIAVDPFPLRREFALKVGATHAVSDMAEANPLVQEITRGVMADAAILSVSLQRAEMFRPLISLVSKGGRICLTSVPAQPDMMIDFPISEFTMFQKQMIGNVGGGGNPRVDMPRLMALYREGRLLLDELATRRYKLDEINEGYQDMLNGTIMRGLIVHEH